MSLRWREREECKVNPLTSGRGRNCSMSLIWREREECKVNPLVAGRKKKFVSGIFLWRNNLN
jgi:hypothetical protein